MARLKPCPFESDGDGTAEASPLRFLGLFAFRLGDCKGTHGGQQVGNLILWCETRGGEETSNGVNFVLC